ncbi:serine O-acetyltransferase EpsC [Hominiventricola aquisgranensis]|jgi:serine O-acetyltransferase|uniref:Serine O-acetyltransferase EpsC n=1 Tax=Hominiventricola aquisgranensis TaxID=3133164 RepID=A0ABV1I2Q6_9FIRM|nr:serine acetyltransferase [Clostridiales bacterium AM23-16LB]RHO80303.1 serine acetyltransferase [Clostridiaceae bacterium AF42-6]RHP47153.1 serine acetyltransferase [Clostridiaceae bacterium AF31-3BH]RHQ21120.1 serine acetyltransferase [Clostridiaceae bacterium AF29-16BH]RHR46178.1 serine acetyltransferase [Clostridiaceae bacterium AF18-31LB]RHT80266.1 serine acetyltransferase [Clostridiaceae bacterium AM27-36LB]RHW00676.1 serine acetyltransferase [Clostridiaceae bacterium OF09-1]
MKNIIEHEISQITKSILDDYGTGRNIDKMDLFNQPSKEEIIAIVEDLLKIVYPGYYRDRSYKIYNIKSNSTVTIEDVAYHLNKQILLALKYTAKEENDVEKLTEQAEKDTVTFLKKIPDVRAMLETDLEAAFQGDPAAKYRDEIILSYPGMFAITVNRLAHELFLLEVPLIPRIMTEYAHSITGIDIHPGATIGKYFFIDHGTGVVVGETTVIGDRVKIYQGVTLGALSTRGGQKLRDVRRHPTIEDDVTIYSGASILGGETVVGKNSVIGSNVFITSSIPADTKVSMKDQDLRWGQ